MKLVFPNGDQQQVPLCKGLTRIGSAPDCDVVLRTAPSLAAEILFTANGTRLMPRIRDIVQVNGRPVGELMSLRLGDRILVAGVEMRLAPLASLSADVAVPEDDTMAVATPPRYVLRGLNGPCLGRLYPVTRPLVVGRAPECNIVVAMPDISRRHAQLRPGAAGVIVEDLDSRNGLWINDCRVREGTLQPGDELRLGMVRFSLVVIALPQATPRHPPALVPERGPWRGVAAAVTIAAGLAVAALLVGFMH